MDYYHEYISHYWLDFILFVSISNDSIITQYKCSNSKLDFIILACYYVTEVLGALVSVIIIWVMTGILVYAASHRLMNDEIHINADIMIITAGVGVGVNIV